MLLAKINIANVNFKFVLFGLDNRSGLIIICCCSKKMFVKRSLLPFWSTFLNLKKAVTYVTYRTVLCQVYLAKQILTAFRCCCYAIIVLVIWPFRSNINYASSSGHFCLMYYVLFTENRLLDAVLNFTMQKENHFSIDKDKDCSMDLSVFVFKKRHFYMKKSTNFSVDTGKKWSREQDENFTMSKDKIWICINTEMLIWSKIKIYERRDIMILFWINTTEILGWKQIKLFRCRNINVLVWKITKISAWTIITIFPWRHLNIVVWYGKIGMDKSQKFSIDQSFFRICKKCCNGLVEEWCFVS